MISYRWSSFLGDGGTDDVLNFNLTPSRFDRSVSS